MGHHPLSATVLYGLYLPIDQLSAQLAGHDSAPVWSWTDAKAWLIPGAFELLPVICCCNMMEKTRKESGGFYWSKLWEMFTGEWANC